jgi:sulfur relay (sulfurtransferase) DsrF/TusC family protein
MRKRVIPKARIHEGLRFAAALLGMDHSPFLVFLDNGVNLLLAKNFDKGVLTDYIRSISDLLGVYVLKESLVERGLYKSDLEPSIQVTVIEFDKLVEMIKHCSIITSF